MHGDDSFSYRTNVKKNIIQMMQENCPDIPNEIIQLFARSRIYMRCKYLNKRMLEESLQKKVDRIQRTAAIKRSGVTLGDEARSKTKKMRKIIL